MVSVCLPSDALSQHLPSYLDFSYLGCGVSLHGCSSKAQLLLLTLDEGYLLKAARPNLERGGVPLSVSYHFAFSYCSWGSQGKNTEVVCHPLLQWNTFCQTSPPLPVHLGWPHMAWLSFIELDKAVVHVIRLASFLWSWIQSVCSLMCSLNAYSLTGVSLTLDVGYLFTAAPAKRSWCSLPWTVG